MYMELKRKRIQIRKYNVAEYQKEAMRQLQPPENLTVSEWAEKYRMLDSKTSAMPGPWRNEKTPYLKEIMDEFINYDTEEIIFCTAMTEAHMPTRYTLAHISKSDM